MATKRKGNRTRTRDRMRHRAIAAKERYKVLALVGSILIGVLVGADEYARGMGGTFASFSALLAFALTGIVFGVAALGIKVDEKYHR